MGKFFTDDRVVCCKLGSRTNHFDSPPPYRGPDNSDCVTWGRDLRRRRATGIAIFCTRHRSQLCCGTISCQTHDLSTWKNGSLLGQKCLSDLLILTNLVTTGRWTCLRQHCRNPQCLAYWPCPVVNASSLVSSNRHWQPCPHVMCWTPGRTGCRWSVSVKDTRKRTNHFTCSAQNHARASAKPFLFCSLPPPTPFNSTVFHSARFYGDAALLTDKTQVCTFFPKGRNMIQIVS